MIAFLDIWVELTAPVVEQATLLRALHGLCIPDALQASSCYQLGPDAVMVSGDADFRRIPTLQMRLISALCTERDGRTVGLPLEH